MGTKSAAKDEDLDGNATGFPVRTRRSGDCAQTEPEAAPSILIVDDTPANLLALEALLSPRGYRLVRAASGEEALRRMLEEEFCLVLIDVQMAGMDGFETAALIKSHARIAQTPLIFVTALSGDANHVFRGYEGGAVDYLVKPVDPHALRSKVKVFVDLYTRGKRILEQDRLLRARELAAVHERSEERFRGLAESVPVIVWASAPNGTLLSCNRAWTHYSGLGANGDVTDPEIVHTDDLERARATWLAARGTGTPWEMEYRLKRRDGAYLWHLVRAVPEFNTRGAISGWTVTATDVDEHKRSHDSRARLLHEEQRARADAEAANRAKDEFLATASHELRAPLNAILGWVQMLRAGMLNDDRSAHALATIERNAHLQRALVEDILDVSRIIAGKVSLDEEPVRLGALVLAAIEAARPAAAAKNIAILVSDDGGPDELRGDSCRLQQALGNLLANAVKFTPEGGSIRVRRWRTGFDVAVQITDTGIGITKDFLPHVFDRFRQADGSSTRAYGGLGLGLAIVQHIVALHGGTVRAESAGLGHGTSLTISLPGERPPPDGSVRVSSPLIARKDLDGMRVLFVDDEPDARELAVEFLGGSGAEVRAASSAEEAMRLLHELRPDVIVSDLGMPKEDGLSLIRRIREQSPEEGGDVPAIAVTGLASRADARRAIAAGFQEHLPKPLRLDKLVEALTRLSTASPRRAVPRTASNRDPKI
jgi:PAS domain S-box-containing protein